MSFTVINAEQRSSDWFAARAGRLTGSRAGDMLARIQKGEAAARRDYRLQLAVERLTGAPQEDSFMTKDMQRGVDLEPAAFAAYEAHTGLIARRTGFLSCNEFLAGCSLDGHIGDFTGIVELKVPKSTTHIGYIKGGCVPSAYVPQVLHNLWVTGAKWCDFVSFDYRMPSGLQFFRCRYTPTDKALQEYDLAAQLFLEEIDNEVQMLTELRAA